MASLLVEGSGVHQPLGTMTVRNTVEFQASPLRIRADVATLYLGKARTTIRRLEIEEENNHRVESYRKDIAWLRPPRCLEGSFISIPDLIYIGNNVRLHIYLEYSKSVDINGLIYEAETLFANGFGEPVDGFKQIQKYHFKSDGPWQFNDS